jgi:hypothetical protein
MQISSMQIKFIKFIIKAERQYTGQNSLLSYYVYFIILIRFICTAAETHSFQKKTFLEEKNVLKL